ncbi:30S ribosomal protein S3, partial [Streptomyces parvus]|nr:30S ribosomal protein S3 [Streptomyces parvus]
RGGRGRKPQQSPAAEAPKADAAAAPAAESTGTEA